MLVSYADAIAQISNTAAPLLFIDTCIFLDIVRTPIRESINAEIVKHAKDLCARSKETPRSLWLTTSQTVENEWHEHIADVEREVDNEIEKLESKRKHFMFAAQHAAHGELQYGQRETELNLASGLVLVSKALLDACLIVSPTDAHAINAMARVKAHRPPAQRGKAEPKDCEIFELFLDLCKDSRAEGLHDALVFVSSNSKDFGDRNAGGIQPELTRVNANLSHNLAWAIAVIDGRA